MRSVNHVASKARRKRIIKHAKGYFGRRKNVWTVAKNAIEKGWEYAYRDRKVKKREFRALWIQRINAGARQYDLSYSKFMGLLKKKGIDIKKMPPVNTPFHGTIGYHLREGEHDVTDYDWEQYIKFADMQLQ